MSERVLLVGGPRDGRILDHDRAEPAGVTIIMSRIPEDGPMVEDRYLWQPGVPADGTYTAVFTGTRTRPEPEPELAVGPATILDTATGKHVEPLAADLTPFLEWPLGFAYGVHCDKQDCTRESCGPAHSGMVTGRDYGTARELLADIKAHAEGA